MNSIDFVVSQRTIKIPWAITPETLAELDYRLHVLKPKVVLECGSGLSTYVLARYAKSTPGIIVISLEHDEKYWAKTLRLIKELKKYVNLMYAPLKENPPLYDVDLSIFPKIEFVLLDGPPTGLGGRSRIFDWLQPFLSSKYEVWIDDGDRKEESAAVQKWKTTYNLNVRQTNLKKGLTILRNYNKQDSIINTSNVVTTMLSGGRSELLDETLSKLSIKVLETTIGLANGGDQETIEVYRRYGIDPIITPYMLRTGTATSFLADLAYLSGKEYWLQLQDDWKFITEDEQWLRRAKNALKSCSQVRLRHVSDTVRSTHAVSRKKFNLKNSKFGKTGAMHWTFNPTLQKCSMIPEIFPCRSETDVQRRAYSTDNRIVTQLYPGCFKHTGDNDSLIDKTIGRRKKNVIDDRLIAKL